jgi:rhamnosyltransferase
MACLTPQYSKHGLEAGLEIRRIDYAITSGNLVRMDVFDKIGTYDEEFFIDCIDFDFSLRVRRAGLSIVRVGAARMQHALGDKACTIPVIGRVHTFHSPLRRYYMYRNGLYLTSRYAGEYPGFVCKLALVNALYLVTILLFGDQRLESIRYIAYGLGDFFRNIKGPCKV